MRQPVRFLPTSLIHTGEILFLLNSCKVQIPEEEIVFPLSSQYWLAKISRGCGGSSIFDGARCSRTKPLIAS